MVQAWNPFDTFLGVPVHPLVVHFTVVLILLVAVLALIVAVFPGQSDRLGVPLVVVSVAAVAAALVTVLAGQTFADRLQIGTAVDQHERAGTVTAWLAVATMFAVLAWYRWGRETSGRLGSSGSRAVSVLMITLALMAAAGVVVTGHLGGTLVWGDVVQATEPP